MDEIQGSIYDVVFRNEQNGYSVIELQVEKNLITVVGFFAYVNIGETIKAYGTWVQHPDYGKQFKMESYNTVTPSTLYGIEKYLASGLIAGIGPHTAKKMVEKFGLDTLDIIQFYPDRLSEIEGIGAKKAAKIFEAFQEQKELRDIMMFLEQYDISATYAVKIYKSYGANTVKEIKENPYKLAEDITGIGFKMADRIALSMGVALDSEFRISSATIYTLNWFHGNGHTYVPQEELCRMTAELLGISEEVIQENIIKLFIDKKLVVENFEDVRAVYSMSFHKAEAGVARRLLQLCLYKTSYISLDIDEELQRLEQSQGISLAEYQKQAVAEAMNNGVLVVTGGPGTGKTTTIKTMIDLFERKSMSVLLAAPTGRAAKRMQEATGKEAKTLHRLLEYGFGDNEEDMFFQKNEDSPLECDAIIVDEVSMIDIILMNNFLKAVAEGTRLILVGDVDQLPSVGPGNVLRDIIDSEAVPVVRLTEIFRQAQESLIVVNAHKINHGEAPVLDERTKDFFFMRQEDQQQIVKTIGELCRERLPKFYKTTFMESIQVLSPMKKGPCGIINLNNELQKLLNPEAPGKKEKQYRDFTFRVGDKVMQIKNNYKMKWQSLLDFEKEGEGIYNGDIGIIINIDTEEQIIEVVYDNDKLVRYDFAVLDELELAYALTVHKSQGSEFPILVMPITFGPRMLLTRNLLYTALTRAKQTVVLVGSERTMHQMIGNNHITQRYSGLKRRLIKMAEML